MNRKYNSNVIFGKDGRVVTEEVILQLVFFQSVYPCYCRLDLTKSGVRSLSLDFTYNRFMMKLFKATDMNVIKDYQMQQPPSEILTDRPCKFF